MNPIPQSDQSQMLREQVQQSLDSNTPLHIVGNGSRLSQQHSHSTLSLQQHTGVISYEPSELVIKVRAGTKLRDIQALLKDNQQQLGTDFPDYGESTIGGAIATGETGSARPFLGAIRDQVLGLGIINGQAKALNFGGQVMKNVAGYDVSRLLCGSYGTLAVITDVTLKVVPLKHSLTATLALQDIGNMAAALTHINQLAAQPLPISAISIIDGSIYIRLSGSQAANQQAVKQLNATIYNQNNDLWQQIDNRSHPFFNTQECIWQARLPATQTLEQWDNHSLINWCGHQRYIKTNEALNSLLKHQASVVAFKNPSQPIADLFSNQQHQALKIAFDPKQLFNPTLSPKN